MKTHEYTKLNVNMNIKHQHLEQICVSQLTNILHKTKCWQKNGAVIIYVHECYEP